MKPTTKPNQARARPVHPRIEPDRLPFAISTIVVGALETWLRRFLKSVYRLLMDIELVYFKISFQYGKSVGRILELFSTRIISSLQIYESIIADRGWQHPFDFKKIHTIFITSSISLSLICRSSSVLVRFDVVLGSFYRFQDNIHVSFNGSFGQIFRCLSI